MDKIIHKSSFLRSCKRKKETINHKLTKINMVHEMMTYNMHTQLELNGMHRLDVSALLKI